MLLWRILQVVGHADTHGSEEVANGNLSQVRRQSDYAYVSRENLHLEAMILTSMWPIWIHTKSANLR